MYNVHTREDMIDISPFSLFRFVFFSQYFYSACRIYARGLVSDLFYIRFFLIPFTSLLNVPFNFFAIGKKLHGYFTQDD